MPTYEYACDKCNSEFEVEQRITEDPIKTCPKCRSRKVRRLISQTSFVLKGGGWYSDLYASGGAKKKSEDASTPSGSGDAAKPSSSDKDSAAAKPAGKDKGSGDKGSGKPAARSAAKGAKAVA